VRKDTETKAESPQEINTPKGAKKNKRRLISGRNKSGRLKSRTEIDAWQLSLNQAD
jgi:hypothetical protein